MVRLKKENPDMSNKETLKLAAGEWRKEKEKETNK